MIETITCFANQDNLFKPLIANPIEARIGSMYQPANDKLRLDIGNSFDYYKAIDKDSLKVNFGADLMTFTRLRSVGDFKFPVETTDYYFGINSSSRFYFYQQELNFRMRIGHISSHLIDGYTEDWIFIEEPFVYSKEFIDLVVSYNLFKEFRLYIGSNLVFSRIPKSMGWYEFQSGFDYDFEFLEGVIFRGGFDFKTKPINNITYTQSAFQSGLFFPTNNSQGIYLAYYFFDGKSIHGMFHTKNETYHSFGVQIYY